LLYIKEMKETDGKGIVEFDYQGPEGIRTVKRDFLSFRKVVEYIDGDPYEFIETRDKYNGGITMIKMTSVTRIQYEGLI